MFAKLGLRVVGIALATATAGVGGVIAASGANAWDPSVWDRVAYCESTWRWDINTGNGYYGGLQFSHSTWAEFGGQVYGAEAHLATKAEQIAIARRVLYTQGPGAWPVCSVKAGLTKENGGADPNAMPVETSATTTPTATATQTPTSAPTTTATKAPTSAPTTTATKAPTSTASAYGTISYNKIVLSVDGVLGPLTIAEMQKWSGSYPDGIWGPKTSRALQGKVGAQVTGVRDRQTTSAVQAYVGADVDGIWGRQTTSYLQRFLNNR
nr:transglycosylase-like protein [Propionibacterium sp.]